MSTALVTGAAGGLGRAVVDQLLHDGWRVIGVDRREWTDERITPVIADLSLEAQAGPAISGLGTVDALIACAGVTAGSPAHETAEEDWHAVLDANLTSAFLCAKHVLPGMISAGSGVIVTIGSVLAHTAAPGLSAYSAAKAGLVGLTHQLAADYGRYGIRAVTISPGWIRTDETQSRLDGPDDEARLLEAHPLNRLGTTEDVASVVAFVVSPSAGLLTGTEITLDGGASVVNAASLLRPGHRQRAGLSPLGPA